MESESRGLPRSGETEAQAFAAEQERRAEIQAQMEEKQADALYIVRRGDQVGSDGWLLEELSFIRFTDRACTS